LLQKKLQNQLQIRKDW